MCCCKCVIRIPPWEKTFVRKRLFNGVTAITSVPHFFAAISSLRLHDLCRRLGLLVDLSGLCFVFQRPFCSRGGVGCTRAAENASGESLRLPRASGDVVTSFPTRTCLCSPPWLATAALGFRSVFRNRRYEVGKRHGRVVELEGLKVQRCLSAAASSEEIHVFGYEVDAGLKALKVLCGAVACCCQADAGHFLNEEADSVLQSLQLQSMR